MRQPHLALQDKTAGKVTTTRRSSAMAKGRRGSALKLFNLNNFTPRKSHGSRARIRQWHAAFLRALAKTPSVTVAARAAHVGRRTVYDARDRDPAFAEKWDSALNQSIDILEHEVFQRALKEDSQLAMFVLKAFRPERYRETSRVEIDQRMVGVLVVPEKELLPP